MMITSPRIFIADFDLVGYSGHFFNQIFGFREAARARGLETRIYIARKADAKIAQELDAQAVLPFVQWSIANKDRLLEGFAGAQFTLSPLWKDLEAYHISERDILVITSSRPQVVFAVGQWLRARQASSRPAVVFRFFGPEFFEFEAKAFNDRAWAYHFASRSLPEGADGGERIFFTLNNTKALIHLERLSLRRAFYLPVPKYYGSMAERPEAHMASSLTIYVHVNRKSGPVSDCVVELVTTILERHDNVKFLVRFCKYAYVDDDFHRSLDPGLVERGVEFLPAEQNHVDYLATIDRSDMVLLPYDPVEYRGIVSGIFCEAAAMGKVAIVPAGTWIADHITEGRAAGVLFEGNSLDDMVEAVERAIRSRKPLQADAYRCAPSFREENSCARNLDGMLELARQPQDMRLSHVPLTDVTKAFGSQHYLGEGWSEVEEGMGAWSDGDRAEINFSLKPDAKVLFFSAQVRPFLATGHLRVDISLTANDVLVSQWSFNDERPGDRDWSWRHVEIPEHVTASDKIQIVLSIRSPVSPKELGLSSDSRKLGIALRQFSLAPTKHASGSETPEKSSTLDRLRRWLKRKLR